MRELKTLKTQTRILLETHGFSLFFLFSLINDIQRNLKIENFRQVNKLKRMSDLDIQKYKSSDTLFIMGSGASINDFQEQEWELIKKHDSMGINFWLIHDFVPTYYMFEPTRDMQRLNTFLKLIELKTDDYKQIPFLVKDVEHYSHLNLSKFPDAIKPNLYVPYKFSLPGNNELSLTKSLKLTALLNLYKIKSLLLFKRASLSTAISFGFKMGYKEIVLCGVDLNNTQYFYENTIYHHRNLPIPTSGQTGLIHKTLDPNEGSVNIQEVISVINRYLLNSNGIKLYIGSKSSALYPMLPYYFHEYYGKE